MIKCDYFRNITKYDYQNTLYKYVLNYVLEKKIDVIEAWIYMKWM